MTDRAARLFLAIVIGVLAQNACAEHISNQFVRAEGTHLMLGRQRFYYYGANCFYLPYFAQDTNVVVGAQSWRDMADEVLARCSAWDVKVIRVFAFNEENLQEFIVPYGDWRFQTSPGVYREEALSGLDYVLNRADELNLFLVLCFVNNWDAYGGIGWYVTQSPTTDKNMAGDAHHDQFYTDTWCRQWYKDHVATLVSRTNSINGRVYRDDPTIVAWQLANEPRCKSDTSGNTMKNWVYEMAAYIKSVDPNHMVSTGEEGWTAVQSWEGTQRHPLLAGFVVAGAGLRTSNV
jgi:mannan endo-1,4-beta-mannosidase